MTEKIIQIVAEILNMDAAMLNENTKIEEVEKWDSLAHVMIIEAIENKLGKSIPIDKAMDIASMKELIEAAEG